MAASRNQRLGELADQIRACIRCPLHASRTHAVPGDGTPSRRAMLIGEAPGADEDESGHPFVGAAGRYLDKLLEEHGLTRDDFFITNVVKCRPPENRKPRKREAETCTSNYLVEQIELVDPEIIMLLGSTAVTYVLRGVKSLKEARGRIIEQDGRRYMASYHPASRFYRQDLGEMLREDIGRLKEAMNRQAG